MYVASDLAQSAPWIGLRHEDRARQSSPQRWLYPDTFDEYDADLDPGAGSITYSYAKPNGPQPGGPIKPQLFYEACQQDRDARTQLAGERVIWHAEDLDFTKTLTLQGRRITVTYEDAPEGHHVGNEFSVDLRAMMTSPSFPARTIDETAGTATLTSPSGAAVTITPGAGSHLTQASLITRAEDADTRGLSVDFRRLHRVLTDAVVIKCDAGGTFDYTIDIDC
jgi:hypothetical protein